MRFADLVAAGPDLLLAATFLVGWIRPHTSGIPSVRRLVMIVLLEFFVVHSSGFMGAVAIGERNRSRTIAFTLGLGAFYTLFLGAFSIGFNDWWLQAVVKDQELSVGGLWTEKPETALVGGAIYFTIIALWQLLVPPLVFRHELHNEAIEGGGAVVTA